jgi:DNA-binding CsgD family transcriptional regulator
MNFPAGIEEGVEIYLHHNHLRVLDNGLRSEYVNLPDEKREIFRSEMRQDKRIFVLLRLMGCQTPEEMELKYVGCRYGALDDTPDLIGTTTSYDPPNCEQIGHCPGFGVVCRIPDQLTRKEFEVSRYIGRGKLDKEICSILKIALPTVRTYIDRIREKLSLNNRVEIALWAQNLGIV